MAVSVGEIEATLKLKDELTGALNQALGTLESAGSNIASMGVKVAAIGTAISVGFTLPLIAAANETTQFSAKFNAEMTKVQNLTDVTAEDIRQWSDDFLALGPALGRTPHELAEGMFAIASAGAKGQEALDILTVAAKASAIGLGEVNVVGRAVTSAMEAYGESNLTAEQATAVLIATVKAGNVEADQLAGTIGRVIGIAQEMGVSFDQVGAFIATFTRLGVGADEAVTALRGTMSTLLKPAKQSEEALASVGLSVAGLRQEIRDKGLTEAMLHLVQAFQGQEEKLATVIPNVRALAGVLGTAGAQGEEFAKIQDEITAAMGNASEVIEGRFLNVSETLEFKWKALSAAFEAFKTALGREFEPIMKGIADAMLFLVKAATEALQMFQALPAPVRLSIEALIGLAAAVGPVMVAIGSLQGILGTLGPFLLKTFGGASVVAEWAATSVTGLLSMSGAMTAVTAVVNGAIAVFAALTSPIALTVAAVVAAGAALIALTGHWDDFMDVVGAAWQTIKDIGTILMWLGEQAIRGVMGWLGELVDVFGELPALWNQIKTAVSTLAGDFAGFGGALQEHIINGLTVLARALGFLPAHFETLRTISASFFSTVQSVAKGATDKIHEYAEAVRDSAEATKLVEANTATAKQNLTGYWKQISDASAGAVKPVMDIDSAMTLLKRQTSDFAINQGFDELKQKVSLAKSELDSLSRQSITDLTAAMRTGAFSIADLHQATGVSEAALKMLEDRIKSTGKSTDAAIASTKKFSEAWRELGTIGMSFADTLAEVDGQVVEGIRYYLARGASAERLATAYGIAKEQVDAIAESMRVTDRVTAITLESMGRSTKNMVDQWVEAEKKAREIGGREFIANLNETVNAHREAINIRSELSLGEYENQKRLILQEAADRKAAHKETEAGYDELMSAIDDLTEAKMAKASETYQSKLAEMEASTSSFRNLFASWMNEIPDLITAAFTGGGGLAGAVSATFTQIGSDIGEKLLGEGGGIAGIGNKLTSFMTNTFGESFGTAFGLALPGIGAAIGALAGPLVSKIGDLFRGAPEWKKLGSDIARDWNVNVSQELMKQMEADSKEFGRQAASLLNMDKIIGEAGGLSDENVSKFTEKLRDVFSLMQTGALSAAQGTEILDKNFQAFVEAWSNGGPLVSAQLVEIVQLTRQAGIESQAVGDFIKGQIQSNIVPGLMAFAEASKGASTALAENKERLTDLQDQFANTAPGAAQDALKAKIVELTAEIERQQAGVDALAVTSQGAAEALAASVAVSFAEMQRLGTPMKDIFAQLGPVVEELQTRFEAAGVSGGEAFDMIRGQMELAKDTVNGPVVDAIAGLGQSLAGLSNIGMLNQQTFSGLTEQMTSMFNKMVEGGVDSNVALATLQGPLQTLWSLAKDYGFAVDEGTQALLDQAEAAGVVGERQRPIQEQMLNATNAIKDAVTGLARVFGVDLPEAASAGAARVTAASRSMADSVVSDVADLGTSMHGQFSQASELVSTEFAGMGLRIRQDFAQTRDSVGADSEAMSAAIRESLDGVSGATGSLGESFRSQVVDMTTVFVERFSQASDAVSAETAEISLAIKTQFSSAKDSVLASSEEMVSVISEDFGEVAIAAGEMSDIFKTDATEMSETLKGKFSEAAASVTNDALGLTMTLKDQFSDARDSVSADAIAMSDVVRSQFSETRESVGEDAATIDDLLEGMFARAERNASGSAARIRSGWAGAWQDIGDNVTSQVRRLQQLFEESLPRSSEAGADAITEAFDLLSANIGSDMTAASNTSKAAIISALDVLQANFSRLPPAARAAASSISAELSRITVPRLVIPVDLDMPDMPSAAAASTGGNLPFPQFAEGSDGFLNFGSGTPAMLHGWEAVVPLDDWRAMLSSVGDMGGGGRGGDIHVTVDARGAFIDDIQLERLANRLQGAIWKGVSANRDGAQTMARASLNLVV